MTMARIEIHVPNWLDKIFAWPVIKFRKYKYGLPFRKIPLGEGFYTIVDPDVFYLLNKFNWSPKKNHAGRIYPVRFLNETGNESYLISIHREIMKPPKGFVVDHKNLITLDNTRSNLRLATHSQNLCNRKKFKSDATSVFTGVCIRKGRNKYGAYINHEGKLVWLGTFDNEIDAAKAYDEAAKKYHGEFARLNFPDETTQRRLPLHIFIKAAKSNDLGKIIGMD
jgi:hypothetical protein